MTLNFRKPFTSCSKTSEPISLLYLILLYIYHFFCCFQSHPSINLDVACYPTPFLPLPTTTSNSGSTTGTNNTKLACYDLPNAFGSKECQKERKAWVAKETKLISSKTQTNVLLQLFWPRTHKPLCHSSPCTWCVNCPPPPTNSSSYPAITTDMV